MQVSTSYSATSLSFASETTKATLAGPAAPTATPAATDRVELSDAALNFQSASLSLSGTTSGKKETDIGFSLNLDYQRASFAAASTQIETGTTGGSITLQRSAGEVTSSDVGFSMESASAGSDHLNDEVSKVSKEIKPAVKEFLSAAGVKGGWGQVNRLLRSVA
jgi:hypothetical protein